MAENIPPEQRLNLEAQKLNLMLPELLDRMGQHERDLTAGKEFNPSIFFPDLLSLGELLDSKSMDPGFKENIEGMIVMSFGQNPEIRDALKERIVMHYQQAAEDSVLADSRLADLLGLSEDPEIARVLSFLIRHMELPPQPPPAAVEQEPAPAEAPQPEPQPSKEEALTLLGEGSPFQHIPSEPKSGITAEVKFATYNPGESYPKGLGRWVTTRSNLQPISTLKPGEWITEPASGATVALKIAHPTTQAQGEVTAEVRALLQFNNLFEENFAVRPVRFFGYGVNEEKNPYLILEYIDKPFELLEDYLKTKGGRIDEHEALEIVLKLCIFFNRAHQQSIVHNDINQLKLDNFFWDPQNRRLRLIDFASAADYKSPAGLQRGTFGEDRKGMGQVLFELITGKYYPADKTKLEEGLSQMNPATRKVIERACYLIKDSYKPFTPDDTAQMLADLEAAFKETSVNR